MLPAGHVFEVGFSIVQAMTIFMVGLLVPCCSGDHSVHRQIVLMTCFAYGGFCIPASIGFDGSPRVVTHTREIFGIDKTTMFI